MINLLKAKGFDVNDPKWDFEENAGIDFYTPMPTADFESAFHKDGMNRGINVEKEDNEYVIKIKPFGQVLIPSGFYSKFPKNIAFTNVEKSGVCTKQFLCPGARLVDTSYQGMIFINVVNWSDKETKIICGKKIAQFVPFLISTDGCELFVEGKDAGQISKEDFFVKASKRGEGSRGSTGLD